MVTSKSNDRSWKEILLYDVKVRVLLVFLLCVVLGIVVPGLISNFTWKPSKNNECMAVEFNRRIDCLPHIAREAQNETLCHNNACLWCDYEFGIKCFYPTQPRRSYAILRKYSGPSETTLILNNTDSQRNLASAPLGKVVQFLRVKLYRWDREHYQVQIFDNSTDEDELKTHKQRYFPTYKEFIPRNSEEYLYEEKHLQINDIIDLYRKYGNRRIFYTGAAPMTFTDQFIQVTIELPSTYVYGLGQTNRSNLLLDFTQPHTWILLNKYERSFPAKHASSSHPFYLTLEADGKAHGVLLVTSHPLEISTNSIPSITFRTLGGILDFHIFLGPSPVDVIKQLTAFIGRPAMPPYWALQYHICRNLTDMSSDSLKTSDSEFPSFNPRCFRAESDEDLFTDHLSAYDRIDKTASQNFIIFQSPHLQSASCGASGKFFKSREKCFEGKIGSVSVAYPDFSSNSTINWLREQYEEFLVNVTFIDFLSRELVEWLKSHYEPLLKNPLLSSNLTFVETEKLIEKIFQHFDISNFLTNVTDDWLRNHLEGFLRNSSFSDALLNATLEWLKEHNDSFSQNLASSNVLSNETVQQIRELFLKNSSFSDSLVNATYKWLKEHQSDIAVNSTLPDFLLEEFNKWLKEQNYEEFILNEILKKFNTSFLLPADKEQLKENYLNFIANTGYPGLILDLNTPLNTESTSNQDCGITNNSLYKTRIKDADSYDKNIDPCVVDAERREYYKIHNLYGYHHAYAVHEALTKQSKGFKPKRPFLLSLSTFPGSGSLGGHWSGEVKTNWYTLKSSVLQMLEFNMYGIPLVGLPPCGTTGENKTQDLCSRWLQLAAFQPLMLGYSVTDKLDPILLGGKTLSIAKLVVPLRDRLLPYLYTLFYRSHTYGEPVVRPLFMEFANNPITYRIDEQFLWGSSLMISPVLHPFVNDKLTVYFPPSVVWYEFNSGQIVPKSESGYEEVSALENQLNIHLRGGTIIASQQRNNNDEKGSLGIIVALDLKSGGATGEVYLDDGESPVQEACGVIFKFEMNRFRNLTIMASNNAETCNHDVNYIVTPTLTSLKFYGILQEPKNVYNNSNELQKDAWTFNDMYGVLTIRNINTDLMGGNDAKKVDIQIKY